MQKEQEHKNQAAHLAQLVSEINQQLESPTEQTNQENSDYVEVNVLNLPPRREVHRKAKLRFTISVRQPFLRFSLVVLLVIIITGVLLYLTGEQWVMLFT